MRRRTASAGSRADRGEPLDGPQPGGLGQGPVLGDGGQAVRRRPDRSGRGGRPPERGPAARPRGGRRRAGRPRRGEPMEARRGPTGAARPAPRPARGRGGRPPRRPAPGPRDRPASRRPPGPRRPRPSAPPEARAATASRRIGRYSGSSGRAAAIAISVVARDAQPPRRPDQAPQAGGQLRGSGDGRPRPRGPASRRCCSQASRHLRRAARERLARPVPPRPPGPGCGRRGRRSARRGCRARRGLRRRARSGRFRRPVASASRHRRRAPRQDLEEPARLAPLARPAPAATLVEFVGVDASLVLEHRVVRLERLRAPEPPARRSGPRRPTGLVVGLGQQAEQEVAGGRVVVVAEQLDGDLAVRERRRSAARRRMSCQPARVSSQRRPFRAFSATPPSPLACRSRILKTSSALADRPRWPMASAAGSWRAWPSSPASLQQGVERPLVGQLAQGEHGAAAERQVGHEVDARQQHVQPLGRGRPSPAPRRRGTGVTGSRCPQGPEERLGRRPALAEPPAERLDRLRGGASRRGG